MSGYVLFELLLHFSRHFVYLSATAKLLALKILDDLDIAVFKFSMLVGFEISLARTIYLKSLY